MTGSQYKNIIQWTLYFQPELASSDSMAVARSVFKNLGVAFPKGNHAETLPILESKEFLGWRPCSCADAQTFADLGVATIGMDAEKIVIVFPDSKLSNLSDCEDLNNLRNPYVQHTTEMESGTREKLRYFAYSYGYELKKDKDT